ncbi:hypothetical protein [Streptomyces albogriseolus]|uniref:hypothetical protein n=1 Tax=Streptomyces albogriseolus TaxID=1887 RepID=UPI00345FB7C6
MSDQPAPTTRDVVFIMGPLHGTTAGVPVDDDGKVPPVVHHDLSGAERINALDGMELARRRNHYTQAGLNPASNQPQYVWTAPRQD